MSKITPYTIFLYVLILAIVLMFLDNIISVAYSCVTNIVIMIVTDKVSSYFGLKDDSVNTEEKLKDLESRIEKLEDKLTQNNE